MNDPRTNPVPGAEETERHPAYGMIGASRVSSQGTICFASRLKHSAFIEITIRNASLSRHLNRDWIHGHDELVQVRLTEAQWAGFVSSLNVGFGVPCTIDHVGGVPAGKPPVPKDSVSEAKKEAIDSAYKATENLRTIVADLASAIEKPSKVQLRDVLSRLKGCVVNFPSNTEFLYSQFEEHIENVVVDAKTSVEAYFMTIATRAGFALGKGEIEAPKMLEEQQAEEEESQ